MILRLGLALYCVRVAIRSDKGMRMDVRNGVRVTIWLHVRICVDVDVIVNVKM